MLYAGWAPPTPAGVWDPEFVPATLVVYEQGYRLPFTVIFEVGAVPAGTVYTCKHAEPCIALGAPQRGSASSHAVRSCTPHKPLLAGALCLGLALQHGGTSIFLLNAHYPRSFAAG